mgnify:CR=1 FL=1
MDTMVTRPEVDTKEPGEDQDDLDEAMPRVELTRRTLLLLGLLAVSSVAFLDFVLPQLADLVAKSKRLGTGDPWWFVAAVAFSPASVLTALGLTYFGVALLENLGFWEAMSDGPVGDMVARLRNR